MKLLYYARVARRALSALKFLPADSLLYFQRGAGVSEAVGSAAGVSTAAAVSEPPAPPVVPVAVPMAGGGARLPRLPFWSRKVVAGAAEVTAAPARVAASGVVELDELLGEENEVLDLL